MDNGRIAENASLYILSVNGKRVRTFRKSAWTRKEVMIYRLGYLRGLRVAANAIANA
jgi:hypothetical protein